MRHGRDIETLECPHGHQWEVEVERSGDGWNEPRTWDLVQDEDDTCKVCGAVWLGQDDWEWNSAGEGKVPCPQSL